MFDYVFNAYHWYLHAWPAFTHNVMEHKPGEWPGYWIFYTIFGFIGVFMCGVTCDSPNEDFYTFLRRASVWLFMLFFWPWIGLLVLPFAVGFGVYLIALAWIKKIPSKEARIAKAQEKAEDIRGRMDQYA